MTLYLICWATWALSNSMSESCSLGLMHRTKWGFAWTRVLRRLSNRVWKSWVRVETGSSPLSSWFSGLDEAEVGEIRKLIPRGLWGLSIEAGCWASALENQIKNYKKNQVKIFFFPQSKFLPLSVNDLSFKFGLDSLNILIQFQLG